MTIEQITDQLSAIEPDEGTYAGIGPAEIPLLEQLLHHNEPWMAARAVFALSRIPDARAVTILSQAAADPRVEVRVAVAASVGKLGPEDANGLLLKLLADAELGVRKFAIQSISAVHSTTVHDRLKAIETADQVVPIRGIATEKLRELKLK